MILKLKTLCLMISFFAFQFLFLISSESKKKSVSFAPMPSKTITTKDVCKLQDENHALLTQVYFLSRSKGQYFASTPPLVDDFYGPNEKLFRLYSERIQAMTDFIESHKPS